MKRSSLVRSLAAALVLLLPTAQAHCAWMMPAAGDANLHLCCAPGTPHSPRAHEVHEHSCTPDPASGTSGSHVPACCACLRLPVGVPAALVLPHPPAPASGLLTPDVPVLQPSARSVANCGSDDVDPPRSHLPLAGAPRAPPPFA